MTITNKQIIETILEIQSHSGLPYYFFDKAEYILQIMKQCADFNSEELIDHCLDHIINMAMIEIHKGKRRGINKNIKSYDWC